MSQTSIELKSPTMEQTLASIRAGCAWLKSLHKPDGSISDSCLASFYYKVPASLALGGERATALRSLDWSATHFLSQEGTLAIPAEQEAKRSFNTYDRAWLAWGAALCERHDIAIGLAKDLLAYQDPSSGGVWDSKAARNSMEGIQHVMSVGMSGLALLATRHIAPARDLARFAIELLDSQPHPDQGFYLAVQCKADKERELVLKKTSIDYFDRQGFKQRPARFGPVQVFLARMYRVTRDVAYLQAAKRYTDLIVNCDRETYVCVEGHKFLWGMVELNRLAPGKEYRQAGERVARYIIEHQQPGGQWLAEASGPGTQEQSLDLQINTTCNALVGLAYFSHCGLG